MLLLLLEISYIKCVPFGCKCGLLDSRIPIELIAFFTCRSIDNRCSIRIDEYMLHCQSQWFSCLQLQVSHIALDSFKRFVRDINLLSSISRDEQALELYVVLSNRVCKRDCLIKHDILVGIVDDSANGLASVRSLECV